MFKIWIIWTALAVFLIVGEIFTAGFFLLPFGLAAAVSAVLGYTGVHVNWQFLVFIILSVIFFMLSRKFADKVTGKQPLGVGAERALGKVGIVIEEIDKLKDTGIVRVDQEKWRAKSANGENIPVDTIVKVEKVEGTRVIVKVKKEE